MDENAAAAEAEAGAGDGAASVSSVSSSTMTTSITTTASNTSAAANTSSNSGTAATTVELPSEVWAHICHYLPYSTVMQMAAVNQFMLHQVMPSIRKVYLFSTKELNAIHAKQRLHHVESVYVYCLLRNKRMNTRTPILQQPPPPPPPPPNNNNHNNNNGNKNEAGGAVAEEPTGPAAAAAANAAGLGRGQGADNAGPTAANAATANRSHMVGAEWGLDYNIDTMHRIVPYLSQFSHLTFVYLGAMVYWCDNSRRVWDGATTTTSILPSTTATMPTSTPTAAPVHSIVIKPTMVGRGDSNADAHRVLIHAMCGAIASKSLSPSTTNTTTSASTCTTSSSTPSLRIEGLLHSHAPRLCFNHRGSSGHVITSFLFPQQQQGQEPNNISAIEQQLHDHFQERRRNCIPCQHVLQNAPCSWLLQSSCNHILCASPKERFQAIVQRITCNSACNKNASNNASMFFQRNTEFITNLIVNGLSMRLHGRSMSSTNTTATRQDGSPAPFYYIHTSATCMQELMALVELQLLDTSLISPNIFYQRMQHFSQRVLHHDQKKYKNQKPHILQESNSRFTTTTTTTTANINVTSTSTNFTMDTTSNEATTSTTPGTTNSSMSKYPLLFSESSYTKLRQLGFRLDAKILEQEYGISLYNDSAERQRQQQAPRPGQGHPFQIPMPPPPFFGGNQNNGTLENFLQHVQHMGAAAAAAAFANHHDNGDDEQDDDVDFNDDDDNDDGMHAFFQQMHGAGGPAQGVGEGPRVAIELNGPFFGGDGGGGGVAAAAFVAPNMVMPNFHQIFGNQNHLNNINNQDLPNEGNRGNVGVQIHFQQAAHNDGGGGGGEVDNDNAREERQNPLYANILDHIHQVVREELGNDHAEQFQQQHNAMMMRNNDRMNANNNNNNNSNNNRAGAGAHGPQDGNGQPNMGGVNDIAPQRVAFGGIVLGNHGGEFIRQGTAGGIQHFPLVMGFGGRPMNGPPPTLQQQQPAAQDNNYENNA